ncbi:MAG TPA: accessory Sec system translocase SecA2 [Vicinamibacterales bacterium]|nr:accessory Sec system translocase SecA2 [Vicinamibacterales bacterium]
MKASVWKQFVARLQGSTVHHDVVRYGPDVEAVAAFEHDLAHRPDADLRHSADDLRRRARSGAPLGSLRHECFALVREAARRTLGQRPFDEQVMAALALDDGSVVEMQTGEGKTLAAVLPAALNALADRGVHVLTFNDYLADRDAAWMGPAYRILGLTVSAVQQGMTPEQRHAAYRADVTYVTAREAGFDHLRDLLATDPGGVVHRPFHFALVDEADSLMIDEARVPLVIAGHVDRETSRAPRLAAIVASLAPGLHFDTDEYARDVELTDAGIAQVERHLECGDLHAADNLSLLTEVNCALHARVLLRRDIDYIVRDGRIQIVDEFTGRVMRDRHWPDGLQAALESKEGLDRRPDGRILGSMTLQSLLRGYPKLSGMTGTASEAAEELHRFYGLHVVVVPTHRPVARVDRSDVVFTHRQVKERAIVEEIRRAHGSGRPVLAGTATIAESEQLAARLRDAGIACAVLNAKNDAEEAVIVARAGAPGAVTISTNMAGRGTDIRLGGEREEERERVASLGGLYVIGTSRHESRRVDRQLRGRAGRQGDPGESRFFVSLEDDLPVRYGIRGLLPARCFERSEAAVDNPVVLREVARAQRIVEGQNFEIRRTLARYSAVLEQQHRLFLDRRGALLSGELAPDVWQQAPQRRAALEAVAGEEAVVAAERSVTLRCLDRAWRDHLARCADLREGIHLVRLGGRDPLTAYTSGAIQSFSRIDDEVDAAVLEALENVRADGPTLDLSDAGPKAPSSTWTYLVNDDPFERRFGTMLTGPGGVTVAMYSAAVLTPLLLSWGLIERLFGRGSRHRRLPRRDVH